MYAKIIAVHTEKVPSRRFSTGMLPTTLISDTASISLPAPQKIGVPDLQDNEKTDHKFNVPYRFYGSSGPILVLVGGFQQSMAAWTPYIQKLAETHRVITITLPGHTTSNGIEQGPPYVTFEEDAQIIHEIVQKRIQYALDHEDLKNQAGLKTKLWGLSLGALIAYKYSTMYPTDAVILESMPIESSEKQLQITEEAKKRAKEHHNKAAYGDLFMAFGADRLGRAFQRIITRQFADIESKLFRQMEYHLHYMDYAMPHLQEELALGQSKAEHLFTAVCNQDSLIFGDDPVKLLENYAGYEQKMELYLTSPKHRLKFFDNIGHFGHMEPGAGNLIDEINKFLETP